MIFGLLDKATGSGYYLRRLKEPSTAFSLRSKEWEWNGGGGWLIGVEAVLAWELSIVAAALASAAGGGAVAALAPAAWAEASLERFGNRG